MLPQTSVASARNTESNPLKCSIFLAEKISLAESHSFDLFWTCVSALSRNGQRQTTSTERGHTKTSRVVWPKYGQPHLGGLGSKTLGDWKQSCKTVTNLLIFASNKGKILIFLLPQRLLDPQSEGNPEELRWWKPIPSRMKQSRPVSWKHKHFPFSLLAPWMPDSPFAGKIGA